MKFRLAAKDLLKLVDKACGILPKDPLRAILQNIVLIATDEDLYVYSTDLSISLKIRLGKVNVIKPGHALVNGNKLKSVLKTLKSSDIDFSYDEDHGLSKIVAGKSKFKINGEDFANYPKMDSFDLINPINVNSDTLREIFNKTRYATAEEQTRFAMNGIYCKVDGSILTVVGTDAKRLAIIKKALSQSYNCVDGIVPLESLKIFSFFMKSSDDSIQLSLTDRRIVLEGTDIQVSAMLLEGEYPPYERILPDPDDKSYYCAKIQKSKFIKALSHSSILIDKIIGKVRFTIEKDRLILTSDTGESETEIDIDSNCEEPIFVYLNPKFLSDAVNVIQNSTIYFKFRDEHATVVLEEDPGAEDSLLYILMPITP